MKHCVIEVIGLNFYYWRDGFNAKSAINCCRAIHLFFYRCVLLAVITMAWFLLIESLGMRIAKGYILMLTIANASKHFWFDPSIK